MGRRVWSRADINRLLEMRDVQKLTWPQIGAALDDSFANCCTRYHYYRNQRRATAARSTAPRPAQPPAVVVAKPVQQPKPVTRPDPVIHRPRYFHEADADIAARIRRQGLTAGFLGDPPPGRSALDQRQP